MPVIQGLTSKTSKFTQLKFDPRKEDYSSKNIAHVFVDGGGNCGPGSIGIVIVIADELRVTFAQLLGSHGQTNNIAELNAIWYGLRLAKQFDLQVIVYSDSAYALNSICGIYNGRKNVELIKTIQEYALGYPLHITFIKCKGHSGVKYNEMADKLATSLLPE